jgi:asparagine N-glycosylation enzyme membrane subunit Stt3
MDFLDFIGLMASPTSHLFFIGLLLLYLLWLQWTNFYKYSITIYHVSLNTHIIIIVISLLVFIVQLICTGLDWYVSKVILGTTVALEAQGWNPYDLDKPDKVEIVPRDTTQIHDRGEWVRCKQPARRL